MKTKSNITSFYHPQTVGLNERSHRTIEQILRSFVNQQYHDWLHYLFLAEIAYNNIVNYATQFCPFEANYGLSPLSAAKLL
jgi:hypothetical protein